MDHYSKYAPAVRYTYPTFKYNDINKIFSVPENSFNIKHFLVCLGLLVFIFYLVAYLYSETNDNGRITYYDSTSAFLGCWFIGVIISFVVSLILGFVNKPMRVLSERELDDLLDIYMKTTK